jgi:hypothetical protein
MMIASPQKTRVGTIDSTAEHALRRVSTCLHCVVTRAVSRLGRRQSGAMTVTATASRPPRVAMEGRDLYLLVSAFLGEAVLGASDQGPVRVRIVDDAHPDVHVLVATGTGRIVRMHVLPVPRHAEGTLTGGFSEVYRGQPDTGLGS